MVPGTAFGVRVVPGGRTMVPADDVVGWVEREPRDEGKGPS